jgi:hypothetical protein
MFDRAFSRHIYDSYLQSFSQESLKTGSAFDLLDKTLKSKPKTTIATDVLERGAMDDLYAGRGLTAREVIDGAGKENIQITFGKGDFAEFTQINLDKL